MNMIDFTGKTVLVTGGARGIGEGICIEFANHGANVAICDLDIDGAKKVANAIDASGGKCIAIEADVSIEADTIEMVKLTVEKFGRIDILINNAGIIEGFKHTIDLTVEEWDKTFAVNTRSVFLGCKAAIPQMLSQGYGRIINTASQMGKTAGDMNSHYAASKAGVILLTKTLAKEFATSNINVNCICPGSVDTPMTHWEAAYFKELFGMDPNEQIKKWADAIPMKRLATPKDVAKVYVFLASEYANYMTGQAINVCGGQEMH